VYEKRISVVQTENIFSLTMLTHPQVCPEYYPAYFTAASIPLLRIMVAKLDRIINLLKPDTNDGTKA